jgi:plasmid stabilization system protein ParE
MTKEVIWSYRAQTDRKNILSYWRLRNKSNAYSKKLNKLFSNAITLIRDFPQIGKPTDDRKVKVKIVRDYLILYDETETTIYILTIWDSRQDPKELEKIIK